MGTFELVHPPFSTVDSSKEYIVLLESLVNYCCLLLFFSFIYKMCFNDLALMPLNIFGVTKLQL